MSVYQLEDLQHPYAPDRGIFSHEELAVLRHASQLLARPIKRQTFDAPRIASDYLRCKLAGLPYEIFGAIFLDAQVKFIADEVMFRGTVTSTAVYPREVVRHAMHHNATSVLLYHNHPSLSSEPSCADHSITERLKSALDLIGVKVQDHFVIAGDGSITSFAERGLV